MNRYKVRTEKQEYTVTLLQRTPDTLHFEVEGNRYQVALSPLITPARTTASDQSRAVVPLATAESTTDIPAGTVAAPMPGKVVRIQVQEGQEISAGDTLLVIEAMKMENNITASKAGIISSILVAEGDEVEGGQQLALID